MTSSDRSETRIEPAGPAEPTGPSEPTGQSEPTELSNPAGRSGRRAFLAGAGAAALAGLGAACSSSDEPSAQPAGAGDQSADSGPADGLGDGNASAVAGPSQPVPFRSDRQLAVLRAPAAAGLVASFDVAVDTREELAATMMTLSAEVERIMSGEPGPTADEILPPPDSGILGDGALGDNASVTLGVGASLFDGRFGLAERAPAELIPMPRFFNDRLVRPELSDGDLALIVAADDHQAAVHALHQAVRVTTGKLRLRWVQEGYNDFLAPADAGIAPTRNLMGFRDGTSNLDTADSEVMNEHVWVQSQDDEPDWAAGGTYVAVRIIRMLIEFWSAAALVRQEQIFGRHRQSGAPLGQTGEGDVPAFAADHSDETVPLRSHIRLANPRTPGTARILRRGFSYLNGADGAGALDEGLLFIAYQRALTTGFLNVQSRLEGEPLEDYIKPVGGGLFFVPPGPGDDGWLGQSLLG
ncbi:MAG: Dyp-type peroxidase [Acidimicrobiales bacterium]